MHAWNQLCRLRLRKNPYIHRFGFRRLTAGNRPKSWLARIAAFGPAICRYHFRHEVVKLAIFGIRILTSSKFLL